MTKYRVKHRSGFISRLVVPLEIPAGPFLELFSGHKNALFSPGRSGL